MFSGGTSRVRENLSTQIIFTIDSRRQFHSLSSRAPDFLFRNRTRRRGSGSGWPIGTDPCLTIFTDVVPTLRVPVLGISSILGRHINQPMVSEYGVTDFLVSMYSN